MPGEGPSFRISCLLNRLFSIGFLIVNALVGKKVQVRGTLLRFVDSSNWHCIWSGGHPDPEPRPPGEAGRGAGAAVSPLRGRGPGNIRGRGQGGAALGALRRQGRQGVVLNLSSNIFIV